MAYRKNYRIDWYDENGLKMDDRSIFADDIDEAKDAAQVFRNDEWLSKVWIVPFITKSQRQEVLIKQYRRPWGNA